MTTPERLRRRQRIEGTFLVIIGLLLIVSTLWFRYQDHQQRTCLATNFGNLRSALEVRGDLANRDSRANRLETAAARIEARSLNKFLVAAFAATDQSGVLEAYGDYRVSVMKAAEIRERVDRRREQIRKEREGTPIPAFPEGTCS